MIHGLGPSSITWGVLSNGEAGLMGPQGSGWQCGGNLPVSSRVSQVNKAENHRDLSTSTNLILKESHCEGPEKCPYPCALRSWRGGMPASGQMRAISRS